MSRAVYRCYEPAQAHKVLTMTVWPLVKSHTLAGRRMVVEVREETRSLAQNARLWAMLEDIARQVDWYGQKLTPEEFKHVFTAALSRQKVVPGIDGGFVVLGKSTSSMTKSEMSELMELVSAFASERGVVFSGDEYVAV